MIDEKSIQDLRDRITVECQPERIILFGSYAYGNPGEDSDLDVLVRLGGRPPDPELGADSHIAEAGAMGDAAIAVIDAVGVHEGTADVNAPATAEAIAESHIEEMDFVFLLSVLLDALGLLDIADEMAEGILPAIADADGPSSGSGGAAE